MEVVPLDVLGEENVGKMRFSHWTSRQLANAHQRPFVT